MGKYTDIKNKSDEARTGEERNRKHKHAVEEKEYYAALAVAGSPIKKELTTIGSEVFKTRPSLLWIIPGMKYKYKLLSGGSCPYNYMWTLEVHEAGAVIVIGMLRDSNGGFRLAVKDFFGDEVENYIKKPQWNQVLTELGKIIAAINQELSS